MTLPNESRGEVLLIDDDEEDYFLLKEAFRAYSDQIQLGYLAGNPGLIASLQTFPSLPSLILLDMNMIGVDGFEVLAFLKQNTHFKLVPVVVWSGSIEQTQVNQCYQAGASSVILKSNDMSGLERTIRHLCKFWFGSVQLPTQETPN